MMGRQAAVTLREITRESLRPFLRMKVAPEQENMVANNAVSIAQAYFEPKAWFRGIYAGDEPVGFIMLYDNADEAEYFLWRLMIAADQQGKGYGRSAVEALIEYVRDRPGAVRLLVSHVPDIPGNPGPFYEKLGFIYTGEKDGIELIMALELAPTAG